MSFLIGSGGRKVTPFAEGKLHKIRDVRLERGLDLQTVAARLGKSLETVASEEIPTADLTLSVVREWSKALGVPAGNLLIERPEYAGIPGLTKQRLLNLEATAKKIIGMASDKATLTFAMGLRRQIREFFDEDIIPLADPGRALP